MDKLPCPSAEIINRNTILAPHLFSRFYELNITTTNYLNNMLELVRGFTIAAPAP
jgi:hypothetical protein